MFKKFFRYVFRVSRNEFKSNRKLDFAVCAAREGIVIGVINVVHKILSKSHPIASGLINAAILFIGMNVVPL